MSTPNQTIDVAMNTTSVRQQAQRARQAARKLAALPRSDKDRTLLAIAAALRDESTYISEANAIDIANAQKSGLSAPMIDRLTMGAKAIQCTATAVEYVASLEDPIGKRSAMSIRPNGLQVCRQRVPLGVIGMVYESRPNVTVDAAVLCLKSGNAVLLRGGKEAIATNVAIGEVLSRALAAASVPSDAIQIVPAQSRDSIQELISLSGLVDLVIPRGGEGLIRFVTENAKVPVIQHYKGVCHLFLDRDCDLEMAKALVVNGKVQRPGVCNALECLLVDAEAALRVLPSIGQALHDLGVEIRGCPVTLKCIPYAKAASENDWGYEFLAKIIAIRVVSDIEQALAHVQTYGSGHSEAICTNSYANAQRWLNEADASCVLVNASTRFNDGGELGLGAEIGISTSKLHAYGPMGLESLTTEKWIVMGSGQVRQ
jgi:glutamate-5-semialdehyde dehydrogenase